MWQAKAENITVLLLALQFLLLTYVEQTTLQDYRRSLRLLYFKVVETGS